MVPAQALPTEARRAKRFVDVAGAPLEALRPPTPHAGYADELCLLWVDQDAQPFHTWGGGPLAAGQCSNRHAAAIRYAADRLDATTARKIAADYSATLERATRDLAEAPATPPPPPKMPLPSCGFGCFAGLRSSPT